MKKIEKYQPQKIEPKWRETWERWGINKFHYDPSRPKYYNLVELPYPSGDLHIGHWFTFAPADAHARYQRMSGKNVFFPNGFDAFGLPAENAAIKRGINPKEWTLQNIQSMRRQFDNMGAMIDWSHEVITCLPEYYRWNQWIFIKMFERGLAYRGKALSNWCPVDQTVLANEAIVDGKCWRCGSQVVQKEIEQWFLAITKYADQLIWSENPEISWPKSVLTAQNEWIGRSEGMEIEFRIQNPESRIKVFTTRPDTIDAATFLVLAPEHEMVSKLITPEEKKHVDKYLELAKEKTERERKEEKEKTGVFTGSYAINLYTNESIPIWIADYVMGNYGTGAIMAVPGEDERDRDFAQKFNLPVTPSSCASTPEGQLVVQYHLRDWSISRQRYWGTPVPMVHCEKCGIVPVTIDQLPVELPEIKDYTPKGEPPLATAKEWLNTICPKCKAPAKRDPETLDTFFDSAWYYYRYMDPHYNNAPFNPEDAKKLMPVDVYFGGSEHTLGHTLYARFFTKFFKDLGMVEFSEFAKKRVEHGIVLGPDGNKMSKSKGNVINPDDIVRDYGADAARTYLSFMMPYEATSAWSTEAIAGVHRFLRRVWELQEKVQNSNLKVRSENLYQIHKTIKKVTDDMEQMKFNTAVAALMEWLNFLSRQEKVSMDEYRTMLLLLAPFAPYITEELWLQVSQEENKEKARGTHDTGSTRWSIHLQSWPAYDLKFLVTEEVTIPVQINGRLRGTIVVPSDKIEDQQFIEKLAKENAAIKKHLSETSAKKIIYIKGKILNIII